MAKHVHHHQKKMETTNWFRPLLQLKKLMYRNFQSHNIRRLSCHLHSLNVSSLRKNRHHHLIPELPHRVQRHRDLLSFLLQKAKQIQDWYLGPNLGVQILTPTPRVTRLKNS